MLLANINLQTHTHIENGGKIGVGTSAFDVGINNGNFLSLNFQDIKVRSALHLLADFSGHDIVVSDTVQGTISLRLNNIPWQQALNIILKARGLEKRVMGSVIMVAPAQEVAAHEKQELAAQQQIMDLEPLRSDLIQINYAKAADIAELLKRKGNSLMSSRGGVSVDERTNTIWAQDTAMKLMDIRDLIHRLDFPVKQVLIETRIVDVDKDYEKELGVRFGITEPRHLTGTLQGANALVNKAPPKLLSYTDRLNVDLPAFSSGEPGGTPTSIGLALAKLGKHVLLDLELSALESEGQAKIIASPRLLTADQKEALIESGEEIPYQEATSSGATAIEFKKAVLSLKVLPQITPNNKIILTLKVSQDTVSNRVINNVPALSTKEIQSNVLVENGQTVVLGGIYQQTTNNGYQRLPFLGSLPFVGALFRHTMVKDERDELLIFVTPKIVTHAINEGYG